MRDVDGGPTTVTLEAVPVKFRPDVFRVEVASIWQDYDVYRRRTDGRGDAERARTNDGISLHALHE